MSEPLKFFFLRFSNFLGPDLNVSSKNTSFTAKQNFKNRVQIARNSHFFELLFFLFFSFFFVQECWWRLKVPWFRCKLKSYSLVVFLVLWRFCRFLDKIIFFKLLKYAKPGLIYFNWLKTQYSDYQVSENPNIRVCSPKNTPKNSVWNLAKLIFHNLLFISPSRVLSTHDLICNFIYSIFQPIRNKNSKNATL